MAEWVATLSERAPTADIAALRSWPADIQAGARLLYSPSTSASKGAAGRRAAERQGARQREELRGLVALYNRELGEARPVWVQ